MSIPTFAHTNFQTLLRAAGDGNLALMECLDATTGGPRYVICAVGRDKGDYVFTPFGHLAEGNPYDAYLPPDPDNPTDLFVPIRKARPQLTCVIDGVFNSQHLRVLAQWSGAFFL